MPTKTRMLLAAAALTVSMSTMGCMHSGDGKTSSDDTSRNQPRQVNNNASDPNEKITTRNPSVTTPPQSSPQTPRSSNDMMTSDSGHDPKMAARPADPNLNTGGKTMEDSNAVPAASRVDADAPRDLAARAADVSAADREFVKNASAGGMYEVQSSKLALTMSKDDNVKKFAQMMIDDHTKAGDELMAIAKSKSIDVGMDLDAAKASMVDKLKASDAFDKEYTTQQTKAHEETVALFQKEASDGQDAELKAFATKTLPTLQGHLDHVKMLTGAMK